jgi:hypothetical protein
MEKPTVKKKKKKKKKKKTITTIKCLGRGTEQFCEKKYIYLSILGNLRTPA